MPVRQRFCSVCDQRHAVCRLPLSAATALTVPLLPGLNPPLWDQGHVGWFQEYTVARVELALPYAQQWTRVKAKRSLLKR